jgi:hypothetical protein
MILGVAGIEHDQAYENHHIGEPIEAGVEKAAETRDPARQTGYLPVQHIEKIGNYQDDAGPEKLAVTEQQAGPDVDGDANHSQQVGIDVTMGQPTHHCVNDSLRPAAYAIHEHSLLQSPAAIMPKTVVSLQPEADER